MEKIKDMMALFNKTSISSFVIGVIMFLIIYITVAAVHSELTAGSKELVTKILDRNFDVLLMLLGYIWGKLQGASEQTVKTKGNGEIH